MTRILTVFLAELPLHMWFSGETKIQYYLNIN